MTASKLKKIAHDLIDGYFERRAEKLDSISLGDLFTDANPPLLCLHGTMQVNKLIESLLRERMRLFEETAFSQLSAKLCAQVAVDSDIMLIQLLRNYRGIQRMVYDETLARVLNRLCLNFFKEFSLPDGSIDWDKLVCFAPHVG